MIKKDCNKQYPIVTSGYNRCILAASRRKGDLTVQTLQLKVDITAAAAQHKYAINNFPT